MMEKAYFAGGCFWCVEAVFQRVEGVVFVRSGYCNGKTTNPTYHEVCTGSSGHAETVEISVDPKRVHFKQLLEVFFATHDASSKNRQGADVGTQYRSGIFYTNSTQKQVALDYIAQLDNAHKITTEVVPLVVFYPAEDYHQDYFNQNQSARYCQAIIAPKLAQYFKNA